MIKVDNGSTEIMVDSMEELFMDVKNVISSFVKFSKSFQVPDEVIEQTLVKMIVDGFNDKGDLQIMDDDRKRG